MSDKKNREPVRMDRLYETRGGEPVRVLCVDNTEDETYPVVAIVDGSVEVYTADGRYNADSQLNDGNYDEDDYDLVEVECVEGTRSNAQRLRSREPISMDRQYVTREGVPARILCTDNMGDDLYPVVALVGGDVITYTAYGEHLADPSICHRLDLEPVKDSQTQPDISNAS